MSHNILENDKITATEKTWHGLETIVPEINLENSGLNWEVVEMPLFVDPDLPEIEGWKAVVRQDKNLVLNVSKKSYEIIQNSRVWETINNSLAGLDYEITVAGSLGNCKKIFFNVVLNDAENYVVNKDHFRNNIIFTTSHDGSLAFHAYDSSIRVVCQNTLNWSMLEKGILNLRVFHTKNAELKIRNMEEEIEKLLVKREEFYNSLKLLKEKPMSLEQADKILAGWLATDKLSTRAENQKNRILELFQNGRGNSGETVFDLFGGVTEFYTHESATEERQFASSEFGSGASKKLEFTGYLFDDEMLDKLASRGEKMLQLREEELAKV